MRKNSSNRRSFLKKTAAATAIVGTPMVSSAAGKQPNGAREIGIENAVKKFIRKEKFGKADAMLEKHDVTFDRNVVRLPEAQAEEDEVSTEDEWNKSESSFSHYSWEAYDGDFYHSFLTWTLDGGGSAETAGPDDGVGATVNPDLWEPILDSWEFSDRCSLDKRGSKGVIGAYNDPNGPADAPYEDRNGDMSVDFEKTEPGEHNIYGTYTHTWNPFGVPGGVSFSLAVGPIGVSASGGTDTWDKRSDNNL